MTEKPQDPLENEFQQKGFKSLTLAEYTALRKEREKRAKAKAQKPIKIILCSVFIVIACFFSALIFYFWMSVTAGNDIERGQYQSAVNKYQLLIKIRPEEPEHYWNIGFAYIGKKDIVNANKQIRLLKKLGKNDLAQDLADFIKKREIPPKGQGR